MLDKIIGNLKGTESDRLLVGFGTADDASVFQLNEELAIINTLDFFTPIVDDPYVFGEIAAANALSDVFAMGGVPFQALNILCFPQNKLDESIVARILQGGMDKAAEAGVVVAGGHSVQDREVKYGLAVSGTVHPQKIWRNNTLQAGDVIVLTKPLGTGVVSTAVKMNATAPEDEEEIIASMRLLNALPAEICRKNNLHVHACTDVTGFGLAGHLLEMLDGNQFTIRLKLSALPRFSAFEKLVEDRSFWPGGLHGNRRHSAGCIASDADLESPQAAVLFDPQTNGGLLIALPAQDANVLENKAKEAGYPFTISLIGNVVEKGENKIVVENA